MTSQGNAQDHEVFALDTNILIYAYDRSEGRKHELCRELLEDGFRGEVRCFVPLQVLSEFYAVVAKGGVGMSKEDALQVIRDILDFPNFIVSGVDAPCLVDGITFNQKHGAHYWDALICAVMKRSGVSKIYTENSADFSVPGIVAVDPFAGSSKD
jgi:predicted nucleic acid-binding protein